MRHSSISPAGRGMITLGSITLLLSAALILFYDSPIGWDKYFYMGLLAGAGWLIGGLIVRSRPAIVLLYAVCMVAAILALVPFVQQAMFHFDPQQGDLYALVHQQIDDEQLGFRVRPHAWGHDANGFRNPRIPADPAIVAIGDSQTWGINVRRAETWPYVLADLTGQSVYSMALGGYGPVEYWVLVGDALEQFAPEVVVIGFYFGNDLYDSYQSVYLREPFARFRDPSMPIRDPTFDKNADGAYTGGGIDAQFTAAYRLAALDLDLDYVSEGLRLTHVLFGEIDQLARSADVRVIVLLIPTKESVYAPLVTDPSPDYARLIDMEARVRADLIAFFDAHQIEYVDSLPALTADLRAGQRLYLANTDGHFNARGCAVLAAVVADYLAAQAP